MDSFIFTERVIMNKKDFGHNVVIPLAQLIKERNVLLDKAKRLIREVERLDDKIIGILDKEHACLMEFLPDPPEDSVIERALNAK